MSLNCIIVDDSAVQRAVMSNLVNNHPDLNLVTTFSNGRDATKYVSLRPVDIIFLDIEMPVMDGFDFIDRLENKPSIIFITSNPEHALKAFDYNVFDFLHKPISVERFNSSVEKVKTYYELSTIEKDDFIYIKSNLKNLKIYTSKIKCIEALGDYVKVITDSSSHLVLTTMKAFEKELGDKFIRVHRSFIVNTDRITSFNSRHINVDNIKIPISRNKKESFFNRMETV